MVEILEQRLRDINVEYMLVDCDVHFMDYSLKYTGY